MKDVEQPLDRDNLTRRSESAWEIILGSSASEPNLGILSRVDARGSSNTTSGERTPIWRRVPGKSDPTHGMSKAETEVDHQGCPFAYEAPRGGRGVGWGVFSRIQSGVVAPSPWRKVRRLGFGKEMHDFSRETC